MRRVILAVSLPLLFASVPAHAQLSPAYRDLLDKAIAGGNDTDIDTLAKYLKQASPDDAAEIDKIITDHRTRIAAAKEEKLRHAGFLQNWKGEGQIGAYLSTGNTDSKRYAQASQWSSIRPRPTHVRSLCESERLNLRVARRPARTGWAI